MLGNKAFWGKCSRRWVALATIPALVIGVVVGGLSLPASATPQHSDDDPTSTPTPTSTSTPTPTSTSTPTPFLQTAPTLSLPEGVDCTRSCASLTITNVVNSGGTATPADWTLAAENATSHYSFTSGQTRSVPKNDTYTLSSMGGPSGYSPAVFSCTGNGSVDTGAQAFRFGNGSNRNATCTFTYSPILPASITVHAGGLRTGTTAVAPLPDGAIFTATPVSGSPAGAPFTCTITDGSGTCQIDVPSGFAWRVGETTAPSGYYLNPNLDFGGSSVVAPDTYVFTTGTVNSPVDVPGSDPNGTFGDLRHPGSNDLSGLLATSVNNPAVSQQCGLNVALVLDQSGSMAGAKQTTLKASANAAIDALTGTPSSVAIYTFATNTGTSIASTPTSSVASAAPLHTFINNLATPANSTNWDAGLHQVPAGFDIVLFITDGAPTAYDSGAGSGSNSYFQYVEQGIYSANALKAQGTRIVGVGVGLVGAEDNLRSVSGAISGDDYFLSTDADFGAVLTAVAKGACNNQLSIQKVIKDPSGAVIANATQSNGWSFTNTISAGSTIASPSVTNVVNGQNGFASAVVAIPVGATPTVTITEAVASGYSFVSAACSVNGSPVTTNLVGSAASFIGAANSPISCIFTNQQNPGSWALTKTSNPTSGTVVSPGDTITYTLSAHNGSAVTVFGASATDNVANVVDDAILSTPLASGLSLAGTTLTWAIGNLAAGETKTVSYTVTVKANDYGATLTNVATPGTLGSCADTSACTTTNTTPNEAHLTLVKSVNNGTTGGTKGSGDWTLSAAGSAGASQVTNSVSGVSHTVLPGTYSLSESAQLTGYTTTGAWVCTGQTGQPTTSSVTIAAGQSVTCTITNTAVKSSLTLNKVVDNGRTGSSHVAGDWQLTASGPTPVDNVSTGTKTAVEVGTYVLSEIGPSGYSSNGWDCGAYEVSNDSVTIPLGVDVTCTVTNVARSPHITLHKSVTNSFGGTDFATDWTLSASNGTTTISGADASGTVTNASVPIGAYTLSESGQHNSGYVLTSLVCVENSQPLTNPTLENRVVTLGLGDTVDCYFSNTAKPALLTLEKTVSQDGANTNVTPDAFMLTAAPQFTGAQETISGKGDPSLPSGVSGVQAFAGTYTLGESGPGGFTNDGWVCNGQVLDGTSVTLANGEDVTCVVTNTAILPHLTLVKDIQNNAVTGGTSTTADWTLSADGTISGGSTISGHTLDASITDAIVATGTYSLSELGSVFGYDAGTWSCVGATSHTDSTVTLSLDENVTCTIVNTAHQSTLTLHKVVDNGTTGSLLEADAWSLSASGGPTSITNVASDTQSNVAVGTYDLSESGPSGYSASGWDCGPYNASSTSVTIPLGVDVTCTITNTAIAPTLTLYKSVENPFGGSTPASAWILSATIGLNALSGASGVTGSVPIGTYDITESSDPVIDGYELTSIACISDNRALAAPTLLAPQLELSLGQNVTCYLTNTDQPALLTLQKTVSQGGANTDYGPGDFFLSATPQFTGTQAVVSGPGESTGLNGVLDREISAGTYQLSESGPAGFTTGDWECTGGSLEGDMLTVTNGESASCTITNTAILPKLTLVKNFLNDGTNGVGNARSWVLTADGTLSGGSTISGLSGDDSIKGALVPAGTYTLSEAGGPFGYATDGFVCVNATVRPHSPDGPVVDPPAPGYSVTLGLGDDVTCTILNTAIPASFNDTKTSDPATGSVVVPGQTISYTVTVQHLDGVVTLDHVLTDDLSGVLGNATFINSSLVVSQGEAELVGTSLTWHTGSFDGTVTITYAVTVNAGAYGKTLTNVITPVTGGECDGKCSTTHYVGAVDMAIQKSHFTGNEDNAVVSGKNNTIDYRLVVRNNGETAGKDDATGVSVRDTMAFALTLDTAGLDALNPSGDWNFSDSTSGQLVAHYVGNGGVFVAGTSSTINYVATVGTLIPPGSNLPTSNIDNEGCVAATQSEANMANNCSPDRTIAKWVLIDPQPFCRNNTPYISYSIPLSNGAQEPLVALIWWSSAAFAARTVGIDPANTAAILADGASQIDTVQIPAGWHNGDIISGEQLWPGAAVDAAGNPIAWAGWVHLPSGQWALDPAAPFYNIRNNAIIEVRTTSAGEAFAEAALSTPGCTPLTFTFELTGLPLLPNTGLNTATWLLSGAYLVTFGVLTAFTHRRIRRTPLKKKG